jgi:hypothetical protein
VRDGLLGRGMGVGAQCDVRTRGHGRWMGCGLEWWDAMRDNARELRPDAPSVRTLTLPLLISFTKQYFVLGYVWNAIFFSIRVFIL